MTPPIPRGTRHPQARSACSRSMKLSIFSNVRACAGWIDMRDLGAVLDHEEPLPHPACDQAQ
jgi:hypothetical protein